MKTRRDERLSVTVKNGAITISIGVDVLAWAFERSEDCQPFNDGDSESMEFIQRYLVTDTVGFAADVKREMERDDDVGNTELYKFLDRMCMAAVEDGSEHIDEPTNMPRDDRPYDERAKEWHRRPRAQAAANGGK